MPSRYGCTLLAKMDKFGGCVEVKRSAVKPDRDGLDFSSFSDEMFLDFCVLSGCDYLPSIRGLGPKTLHELLGRFKEAKDVIKVCQVFIERIHTCV